ncbi:hypothetical protein [Pyrobaculum aerophilum]|uniref:hypothetical protein n=1 Tax=Pyrobaculum aerophilum TaxID=13773 RepID=UPI0015F2714D|nr:hypothetical protein [Pyrobaculum aerophilum]
MRQDGERALVLAALTGDGSIKEKGGVAHLYARHLFPLAKLRGVGVAEVVCRSEGKASRRLFQKLRVIRR